MAEEIDILTYSLVWLGAALFFVVYGMVIALIQNRIRKKRNETR